jgi:hypothetical protein
MTALRLADTKVGLLELLVVEKMVERLDTEGVV